MALTDLWTEASYDAEAEIAQRRLTAARTAALGVWPFLAAAESAADYKHRKALVADKLDKAAERVCREDPAHFAVLRAEVEASFDADYDVVFQDRMRQVQAQNDRRAAERAQAREASKTAAQKSARDLAAGDVVDGKTVSKVDTTTTPGTVYVWFGGKTDPPADATYNHGDPVRVSDGDSKTSKLDAVFASAPPIVAEGFDPRHPFANTHIPLVQRPNPNNWYGEEKPEEEEEPPKTASRKTAEEHGGYHLEEGDGGWYVVNHIGERKNKEAMPRDKALDYQRALMVNVPGAKEDAEKHEESGDQAKRSSKQASYVTGDGKTFDSEDEAKAHASEVFDQTGNVISVDKKASKQAAGLENLGDDKAPPFGDDDDDDDKAKHSSLKFNLEGFNAGRTAARWGLTATSAKVPTDVEESSPGFAHSFFAGINAFLRQGKFQKGAPFANYDDFDACVKANSDKDDPEAYCGKIKHETEDKKESSLQTQAEFPPKKDSTGGDSSDGNPFAKKDKDPTTDDGGDKGGSADPTTMQPGQAVTLNYTLTGSAGGNGSCPATFDSTDGTTYYFTYSEGRFGVTQQGGKWVDSAGTEFTFDASADPNAQQATQPIDAATQAAGQPPAQASRRPFVDRPIGYEPSNHDHRRVGFGLPDAEHPDEDPNPRPKEEHDSGGGSGGGGGLDLGDLGGGGGEAAGAAGGAGAAEELAPLLLAANLQTESVAWGRRHYEDLASAISAHPDREHIADHFSHALKGTNPQYREDQFRSAASTPGYRVRGGTGTANYSRGHYQRIADAVKTYSGDRAGLAEHLANHFAATSHNFDHDRFIKATAGLQTQANPYGQDSNPYLPGGQTMQDAAPSPGQATPDVSQSTPSAEPPPAGLPMSTRPRQRPQGPQVSTPSVMPTTTPPPAPDASTGADQGFSTASLIPVKCEACNARNFLRMASLTTEAGPACPNCGSDEIDVDDDFESTAAKTAFNDIPMDQLHEVDKVKQKVTCSSCLKSFTVTATDPAQPLPPCPNCGSKAVSAAGGTSVHSAMSHEAEFFSDIPDIEEEDSEMSAEGSSKVAQVAAGILAANPGLTREAANDLAARTVERFPRMVEAAISR